MTAPVNMQSGTDTPTAAASPRITLSNPVREHFESFIYGNALLCDAVVEADSAKGQTVVVCGAGPSLADHAAKWCPRGDQVWGCNSALPYLYAQGHRVTHGFTVDQTPHMCEEWADTPDVEYLVASTVHPHLTQLLRGRGRSLTFFHNYVGLNKGPVEYCACAHDHARTATDAEGRQQYEARCGVCDCTTYRPQRIDYEDWLYASLYPPTARVGSGLNSVTRAIDLAYFAGAARVIVLGADCAIRVRQPRPAEAILGTPAHRRWLEEHTQMHADGGSALASGATATVFEGVIDGRYWLTKPDMAVTAVWLERWRRNVGRKRLTLIGDTLPNALQGKDDAFLDRLPAMVDGDDQPIRLV